MSAPAEATEPTITLPVPAFGEMSRWQLAGFLCAWGGELLFPDPGYRLATVHDPQGYGHDLMVCQPCLRRRVDQAVADAEA
ncbi:hypothetical protein [Streptomyces hainanensis]|uniref:Uncharacterized protein n=1 Tax=Streptomyces hainanensis TaxID=402648 RepID=A0A4R4TGB7_9ACTN|nr:hypothetical protein [Streptomyces hainanensis]TDC73369.1 hypothetical protein E1283_19345 [Streptomyces hainanensis]